MVLQPIVERQVMGLLPASFAGTQAGRWTVKIGSTVLIGYGAKTFLGKRAGDLAMLTLGANLLADAVGEFTPQLTGMGYYPQGLGYVSPGMIPSNAGAFTGVYPALVASVNNDPFKAPF